MTRPGAFVIAVSGTSGSGKSTLVRVVGGRARESSDVVLDGLSGSDDLLGTALTEVAAARARGR